MNRWSTAGFVPPSVYIGFPLFVLAKGRSGHLSTIPWRARRTVGFWATRPVGDLFCPARCAPPPRRAPRRPEPPVVCPGFGLDRYKACSGNICFASAGSSSEVLPVGHPGSDSTSDLLRQRLRGGVQDSSFWYFGRSEQNILIGLFA